MLMQSYLLLVTRTYPKYYPLPLVETRHPDTLTYSKYYILYCLLLRTKKKKKALVQMSLSIMCLGAQTLQTLKSVLPEDLVRRMENLLYPLTLVVLLWRTAAEPTCFLSPNSKRVTFPFPYITSSSRYWLKP